MTYKEFRIQYSLGTLDDDILCKLAEESKNKRVLEILSKDKDNAVRSNVAYNPNTPKKVLEYLSKDKDSRVRYCAAYNLNTPKKILEILSKDKDYSIRYHTENILLKY